MFFLGWLAFCFLVVGAINLYLRHFGLPKGRGQAAAAGRVGGYDVRSTGYGSITFSGLGARIGGSPFSGSSSVVGGGETGHWINGILSWIYQTQSRVPDFVESWLKALTTEADKQAKEMQVRFEGIHGSPPEFSHFRTEPASTEKDFTILMTVTLRDVTLQTSTMAKSTATKATQPVKCDVYLQNLTGQVKAVAKFDNNELCLHLSFISEPNIKLQIRPTRVDYVIDNSAFDKVVRAAISNATMNVDWTSRSTSARPSNLRITEPNSVQRFSSDTHQVSGQTARTPPSKSPPLHATFRDDTYNDDQRSSAVASRSFTSAASQGHTSTQERQSPLSQNPQTATTFQGQQPHLQQQGQYQGHGQYPEVAQGQQYSGASTLGQGQYQSTGQGQQYPGTGQGQQYPSAGQGQQYPSAGQGQQYPSTGQGQQYPSTGQGQQYPGAGQVQQYPSTSQGQQYPSTGQGQQYPSTGQGQQYPSTGQEQQYPNTGQGQQYPSTGQGQQYPSTGQGQQYPSTSQGQLSGIAQGQISPQALSQGPKLLIKVVKANGLIDTDFGNCSAFCRVHVDNPPQDFTTNVIRNTVNPYWDEQFISDLHADTRTKQIQFEVFDRDRQPGNDLLGKAVVLVDEIRRMPSSRQIIPLTGKPKSRTSTSGSVTVEFVFRESLDSSPSLSSASTVGSSPHPFALSQQQQGAAAAPIQKQTSVQGTSFSSSAQYTPVTGPGVNEHRGRKDDRSRSTAAESSTYAGRSGSASGVPASGTTQLSAHNLALTSSQAGSRSYESPTVVVTGAESLQPSKPTYGTLEANTSLDTKKKESFASTLKRKLARVKIKPRSQSADRATSHSMREGSLLRPPPPGHAGSTLQPTPSQSTRNTDFTSDAAGSAVGIAGDDGTLRKARSNSFSSSLRRIFRRDKKDISRESSLKNPSSSSGHLPQQQQGGRGDGSREALTAPEPGYDRSRRRQNTPDPSGDRFATGGGAGAGTDFTYSSSVPAATSPLHNR